MSWVTQNLIAFHIHLCPKLLLSLLDPVAGNRTVTSGCVLVLFLRLGAFRKMCPFSFVLAGGAEVAQDRQQLYHQAKKNRTSPAPYSHPSQPAVPGQSRCAWNPSCSSWLPAILPKRKQSLCILASPKRRQSPSVSSSC